MTWNKTQVDPALVKEIASRYGLDLVAAAILVRRGLTDPAWLRFFFESDIRFLHNPFLLDEMGDAVERILTAASEGEKVHVFGDRDVDGVTSTALMTDTLQNYGVDVSWAVPMGDEAYGLTRDVVDRCLADDVTLLVAVDCGTTNVAEIRYAAERGIDTIVVDHHNPQEERPPAVAIVNPKLPDSSYPFDGLCACALVSKLRQALGFSQSEIYNQTVCLLNVRPGNESLILDAVKMENLIETDRISESLVPEVLNVQNSRLGDFLQGLEILVYDAPSQERMLRKAFGNGVDIHLIDVAPEFWSLFPSLDGKSLLRLRTQSRLARYADHEPSEIDVFASLFRTFVHRKAPELEEDVKATLDLVSVATLADMMPMRDENRIVVSHGLRRLTERPRAGLRELLERQKLIGKSLETRDIGWNISPVINAAGRMGEPDRAVKLLLESDEAQRMALADELIELNRQRRRVGDDGWTQVQDQARQSHETHAGQFIFVFEKRIHRGVTGILAGRLARHFLAPSAVVTEVEGRAVGSLRSARGLVATALLAKCDDILDDWGGHDAAAGFHLPIDRLPTLEQRIQEIIPQMEIDSEEEQTIDIDAEIPRRMMDPGLRKIVKLFSPYGQEHPPLAFLTRGVRLASADIIGKKQNHVRLLLDPGEGGVRWPAVFWGAAERFAGEFTAGDTVDAVFYIGTNYYQGNETPQLTILDMRADSGPDS